MTSDPAAMTEEQVRRYREAVAALVAASLQKLREHRLPDTALPAPQGAVHE
jgi:hypothetical protein